jgi:rhodanese-related sulfurtransferase
MTTPTFQCLSAEAAAAMILGPQPPTLFDVRDLASYQRSHIEGAMHLTEPQFSRWVQCLPRDTPIVIYCYHGNASKVYAEMFCDFRFGRVFSVDGGYAPLAVAVVSQATSATAEG